MQYPLEVLNRAAAIFRMAGHMLGERLLHRRGLVVSLVDDDPQTFPLRRGYLGLDLCQHAFNSRGAGLHGCWSLSRAAFVLSRATRWAISSMRASSCSSFWVSRHARMMPRPLQIRAPTWLSSVPSAIARIVLARPFVT